MNLSINNNTGVVCIDGFEMRPVGATQEERREVGQMVFKLLQSLESKATEHDRDYDAMLNWVDSMPYLHAPGWRKRDELAKASPETRRRQTPVGPAAL
jgi:hypothetical protein